MAKKKTFPAGYLTLGRCVHLGRTTKKTRSNAKAAGLIPLPAAAMGRLIRNTMALQRIVSEGVWYDTVKY